MRPSSVLRIVGPGGLTPDEMAMVTQLVARCNQAEGLDLPIEATAEEAGDGVRYCLAWGDSRLIGLIAIQGRDEVEMCIAVDPDYRRRGVGRALLASAQGAIRDRGASSYLLVADEASLAGRAFVAATGARYHGSEYRLALDEQTVPAGRDWQTTVELQQGSSADTSLIARLIAASFGDSEAEVKRWVEHAVALENHRFFIGSVDGEPIGIIRTNCWR